MVEAVQRLDYILGAGVEFSQPASLPGHGVSRGVTDTLRGILDALRTQA
jgi:hypothetical protein